MKKMKKKRMIRCVFNKRSREEEVLISLIKEKPKLRTATTISDVLVFQKEEREEVKRNIALRKKREQEELCRSG